ncbi:MAG TPA: M56 family metallopeptidase [Pirellulales bacterium]|nr:M56 family metallopeptidase [Pirellulales bacterium]
MWTTPATLEHIAAWVLRTSWQASAVAMLVLLVQAACGRVLPARWRHALWWLVVARLLLIVAPTSDWSLFNLARRPPAAAAVEHGKLDAIAQSNRENGMADDQFPPRSLNSESTRSGIASAASKPAANANSSRAAEEPRQEIVPSVEPALQVARDTKPPILPTIDQAHDAILRRSRGQQLADLWPLAWFTGVVLFALRFGWTWWRLDRYVRRLPAVSDERLLHLLADCRRTIGVAHLPVALVASAEAIGPALAGVFRPRMIVPHEVFDAFGTDELRFVLLHELAHLKRRDVALNWLVSALEVLHWFNPLVWLAFGRMRFDRELACDALVLERVGRDSNQRYGQTLIKLMERFRPRADPGAAGMLGGKRLLKRRIVILATFKPASYVMQFFSIALLVGLAVVVLTDPAQSDETRVPGKPSTSATVGAEEDGPLRRPEGDVERSTAETSNRDRLNVVPLPKLVGDAGPADQRGLSAPSVPPESDDAQLLWPETAPPISPPGEADAPFAAKDAPTDPWLVWEHAAVREALRDFDRNQAVMVTTCNRRIAAAKHVTTVEAAYEAGTASLDMLLDAQRRLVDAEIACVQAAADFGKQAVVINEAVARWMNDRLPTNTLVQPRLVEVVVGSPETRRPKINYDGKLYQVVGNDLSDVDMTPERRAALLKLRAVQQGRDGALKLWRKVYALQRTGAKGGEPEKEAQAREQYFLFRSEVQNMENLAPRPNNPEAQDDTEQE